MKWIYSDTPRQGEEEFGFRDQFWRYGSGNAFLVLEMYLTHWHAKLIIGESAVKCVPVKGSTDEVRQQNALRWACKEWERIKRSGDRVFE